MFHVYKCKNPDPFHSVLFDSLEGQAVFHPFGVGCQDHSNVLEKVEVVVVTHGDGGLFGQTVDPFGDLDPKGEGGVLSTCY